MPAKQRNRRLIQSANESRGKQRKTVRCPRAAYTCFWLFEAAERDDVLFAGFCNRIFFFLSHSLLIGARGPQVYLRRDCSRYKVIMGPACCVISIFFKSFFFVIVSYTVLVFGGLRDLQRNISLRIVVTFRTKF